MKKDFSKNVRAMSNIIILDGWDVTDNSNPQAGGFIHMKNILINWIITARSLKSKAF
jgi:hypothetical protein